MKKKEEKLKNYKSGWRIAEGQVRFEEVFIEVEDLEMGSMLMVPIFKCCLEEVESQEKSYEQELSNLAYGIYVSSWSRLQSWN